MLDISKRIEMDNGEDGDIIDDPGMIAAFATAR